MEQRQLEAFRLKMRELGHVEGENLTLEFRWAEGRDEWLPALAEELVRLKPDVIITTGTPGTLAAKGATRTIPVVFASSGNPVSTGLVASYARPGGNVTGFTILGPEAEGKRVQLLKELIPGVARIAVIWNSANPAILDFYNAVRTAAAALDLKLDPLVEVRAADELTAAFATIAAARPDAMLIVADRFLLAHRREIIRFAAEQRLPTVYPYRSYVEDGGLMSYAHLDAEQFRRTAVYVDKILNGAKPSELPVQEPNKFDLIINLKSARALGLSIPATLLARADEVIE
jgi:putative ABC transport system substrate-binding protein